MQRHNARTGWRGRGPALADGATDDVQIAERLFYAVRDGFRYDPYNLATEREAFKASNILGETATWCVPKSIVLTALARASGIPARLSPPPLNKMLCSPLTLSKCIILPWLLKVTFSFGPLINISGINSGHNCFFSFYINNRETGPLGKTGGNEPIMLREGIKKTDL